MIVLKNISKALGGKEILKDVSFHIGKKEKIGLIGLNGAGKTTVLNVIAGMIRPDKGFLRVNGTENMLTDFSKLKNMLYVSGTETQLWEDINIQSSYENCMKMYGIKKKIGNTAIDKLDEIFQIKPFLSMLPNRLSLGERMRCELVYALLANPQIFLLDEAMIGLDVSVKHKIMEYFEQYRKETDATMIFTSHNLWEVETLCDRVIVIDNGSVLFDGSVERIMREYAPFYHMKVKIQGNFPDFEDLPVEKLSFKQNEIEIVFDKKKIETAQIIKHMMARCKLENIQIDEPNLEETIRKLYERERSDGKYD